MNYKTPKVVSEIGCNHKGDIGIAFELLDLAKDCGADVAKFQKRNSKELLPEEQYNNPHPNPINSYGKTYGEHREFLEFTINEHEALKKYCERINIEYSTSVWDVTSAKEIISLKPNLIKVPSACNNHFEMLKVLRDEYSGDVHISLGMTRHSEELEIINLFNNSNSKLVIYACTSGYPVKFEDVCLLEITRLMEKYSKVVYGVGFSGHHLGIALDVAAYTLGARWIERHFTKDRTWKGTDHAASLEYNGLKKLSRDLNSCFHALCFKEDEILPIERFQWDKLKNRK